LTDANLVLGYLDAGFFLGGDMALDMRLARDAIIRDVASPLSLEGLRAAWGIHEVINEDIARAFRIHAVERGFDCRRATIVAFGGGGPIHGTAVARKLKAPRVLFPVGAGVMSALGLLYSPMMFEVARSLRVGLAELTAPRFAEIIDGIVAEAVVFLSRAGLAPSDIVTEARVDMRYRGQGYELEIVLPADVARATVLAELSAMFVARYREVFRVDGLDEPLEIISWKAEARGPAPMPPAIAAPSKASGGANGLKGYRDAFFSANAPTRTPVIDRYALRPGDTVVGPGIVEERESTCVLRPGDRAVVDERYNLVVEVSL
jgi:N-methylhydantoinase A